MAKSWAPARSSPTEGKDAKGLVSDFYRAVDDYLSLCVERGIEPERDSRSCF